MFRGSCYLIDLCSRLCTRLNNHFVSRICVVSGNSLIFRVWKILVTNIYFSTSPLSMNNSFIQYGIDYVISLWEIFIICVAINPSLRGILVLNYIHQCPCLFIKTIKHPRVPRGKNVAKWVEDFQR